MPFIQQKKLIKKNNFCLSLVIFKEQLFDENIELPPHISSSVRKRRSEYYAGRLAAGDALSYFNLERQVGTAKDRSPIWPKGSMGSITHNDNVAAAVVSNSVNIGIDVEGIITDKVAIDIGSMVATRDEIGILPFNENESVTLIFSAKESIFKCLYPDVKRFFDFKEAELKKMKMLPKNIAEMTFSISSNLSDVVKIGTQITVLCLITSKNVVTIGLKSSELSEDLEKGVLSALSNVGDFLNGV